MKYYTKKQTTELVGEHFHDFNKFMFGQTVPIVDGEDAFYKHDVDKFLESRGLPVGEGKEL